MSEVYKSTTHGDIALSFEGRRLMQNLRYAIQAAISNKDWHHNDNAVSKARGDIAKYISDLERRVSSSAVHTQNYGCKCGCTYQLPAIPEGYELSIVGGIVLIYPIANRSRED